MSNEYLSIRNMRVEDATDLQKNCFVRNTPDEMKDWSVQTLSDPDNKLQLVADYNGEVIGSATLIREQHPLSRHIGSVCAVVVSYHHQRKGIARALIKELERAAPGMGITILTIGCRAGEASETVYRKLGFIEYSRLPNGIVEPGDGGKTYDSVELYRSVLERKA
ncbi:MAG: GNAT family N-acetyltransferase [Candidatus Latescibacterota bacterium]